MAAKVDFIKVYDKNCTIKSFLIDIWNALFLEQKISSLMLGNGIMNNCSLMLRNPDNYFSNFYVKMGNEIFFYLMLFLIMDFTAFLESNKNW